MALEGNTSIESVTFTEEFLASLMGEREDLLMSLASLKNLREVCLGQTSVQVTTLTKLVESHKELQKLHLYELLLQGVDDEFDQLERALAHTTNLKDFEAIDCRASKTDVDLGRLERAAKKISRRASLSNPTANTRAGALTA
jgi:hypothetical protein